MAITLRTPNGTTTVAYGTRTNTSVSRPSGMAEGDVAVVLVTCGGSTLVQPAGPAGAELISRTSYSAPDPWAVDVSLWAVPYAVGSSWTFTHASRSTQAYALALVGVDATTMQDVAAATAVQNYTPGGTATATAPSINIATAGAWEIFARGSWDGNAITPPSGVTERYDVPVGWLGTREAASTGATGSVAVPSGNGSGASPWGIIHAALRPAGTGGGEAYTGTLSASVPRVASSISGTATAPTYTGTLSASTARAAASLSGAVTTPSSAGTVATITPRVASSLAGTVTPPTYSGTSSGTLPTTTGSLSGTATPPTYSGTLTAAIPPTRSTITGAITSPAGAASLSGTLPRISGTLAGTVASPTWTGGIDGEFAPITGAMLGTVAGPVFTGSLDGTLAPLIGGAAGTATAPADSGALVATLPRVVGSLAGVVEFDGALPVVEVGTMRPARFAAAPALSTPVVTSAAPRFVSGTPLPQRYTRRT